MTALGPLPAEFLERVRALEEAYCAHSDPMRQSGFAGGAQRWRAEREPILQAVAADGDLLDIGCANGYLLECLVAWAAEQRRRLMPHGLDIGPRLIGLARQRWPGYAGHFHVGNAWEWRPARRYRYVYSLWDCVPETHLAEYCRRLVRHVVEPGGRLIVGMYGSRSRGIAPMDVGGRLEGFGMRVAGTAVGGEPPVSSFAWFVA
jgi:hypothetical protein